MKKLVENITDNVWRIGDDVFVYIIRRSDGYVVIDTGNRSDRQKLEFPLKIVVDLDKVDKVIFTHLHADCIGNFDLFSKAGLYASEVELADFRANAKDTVLDADIAEKFKKAYVKPLFSGIAGLEVIPTPGHTMGSICLYDKENNCLFTGDTYFGGNVIGSADLPTSSPSSMQETIMFLQENFATAKICPLRKKVISGR